ncbi:ABA4-like family protein [Inquilinus sp.]|uniref:ABA4-like family protein n=1 Tax=Inquilinus sp. TaxID=1932117 RepID=UPI0031D5132F
MLDLLFRGGNMLAILGWLALAAAPLLPRHKARLRTAAGLAVPLLFAAAYLGLVGTSWGSAQGGYGSIAAVRALFDSPGMLVAGWLHYLAFDLFVGAWIAREGERAGLPHLLLIPCFALTFLFGPIGLLAFALLRAGLGRRAAGQAAEA